MIKKLDYFNENKYDYDGDFYYRYKRIFDFIITRNKKSPDNLANELQLNNMVFERNYQIFDNYFFSIKIEDQFLKYENNHKIRNYQIKLIKQIDIEKKVNINSFFSKGDEYFYTRTIDDKNDFERLKRYDTAFFVRNPITNIFVNINDIVELENYNNIAIYGVVKRKEPNYVIKPFVNYRLVGIASSLEDFEFYKERYKKGFIRKNEGTYVSISTVETLPFYKGVKIYEIED